MRSVCIPGLTMQASELPPLAGVTVLENPEVGSGITMSGSYSLEDVAELHARRIAELAGSGPLTVCGISMGGLVLSIVATEYRRLLPARTRFQFVVTSPNLPANPTIGDALMASWTEARPGDVESFARILSPFFATAFLRAQPAECQRYFEYRAHARNGQSPRAFMRQVAAVRRCEAHRYFARLDPRESSFVGGGDDRVLGPSHNRDLAALCPDAAHLEIAELGHMIHLERPDLYAGLFREPS
jgi:pimeloyl-ACP methyl ester carboxylesterase